MVVQKELGNFGKIGKVERFALYFLFPLVEKENIIL